MSNDETRSGAEEAPLVCDETAGEEHSALDSTDVERILASLVEIGASPDEATAAITVLVEFGDIGEMLVMDDAEFKFVLLDSEAQQPSTGNVTTPVAEGLKDTALTEIAQSVESGSGPPGALPIKIIFEDYGSASGSLI